MYLCFLLQCLLDQFGVLVILHPPLGKCRWTLTLIEARSGSLMEGLKSEFLVGVCSPCVHEWHWKTTVCCPQATLSLLPLPSVDSGNGCCLFFYIPFLGGDGKTPGTSASKSSTKNLFLFTVLPSKPNLCNSCLPANAVIRHCDQRQQEEPQHRAGIESLEEP